jgi:hypothetical protein
MIDAFVAVGGDVVRFGEKGAAVAPLFRVEQNELQDDPDGCGWIFTVSAAASATKLDRGMVYQDRRASWFYSGGGALSGVTQRDGEWIVYAGSLMVYIHRVLGGQLNGKGVTLPVRVRILSVRGRSVEFVCQLGLSTFFPTSLRYEFVEQAIADFTSQHVPAAHDVDDAGVAGDIVGYSDEVAGDVATEDGASLITVPEDYTECSPLKLQISRDSDDFKALHDVTLSRAESGVAKLRWVADYLASEVEPGGRVFVGGDCPGTLSRRLLYRGLDVVGLDPKNEPSITKGPVGSGSPTYQQRKGRVAVATLVDDHGVDWGGAVFDTALDRHSAETDTAVNCGAAKTMWLEGVPVCVAKARSVPRVPGRWFLLDNPGWEVRGCESYLAVAPPDETVRWPHGARCRVNVPVDGDCVYVRVDTTAPFVAPKWWSWFFKRIDIDGLTWHVVPHEQWYHFVTFRSVDHALARASSGIGRDLMDARSALDAWLALRSWVGNVDASVRQDVSSRLRTDDPMGARGVPREVLQRTPGLVAAMAGRYGALLELCQDPGVQCPLPLGLIMKHPGAGSLLSDLSQLRSLMGEEQIGLADYSRVLPWGSMSILSSVLFFRLFYWLASMTARVFKPWHAWELQHKLWCLSSFGTDEERYVYFYDQFERVFSGVDQMRNSGRRAASVERALRRFNENLQVMDLAGSYINFDRSYSNLMASRAQPNNRRRAVHTAGRAVSVASYSVDSSMPSNMPARGGQPIADLAEYGMLHGWGPRTTLHTVMSATRGRVNEYRAYLYWCSLSPVERPRGVDRTKWVPQLRLNTSEALGFRLPGLATPESFVMVRDEQLAQLREQLH